MVQSALRSSEPAAFPQETAPLVLLSPEPDTAPAPFEHRSSARASQPTDRLGQRLLAMGALRPDDLFQALEHQAKAQAPLGRVLLTQGLIDGKTLASSLAQQWRTAAIDLAEMPPDTRLIDLWGAETCLWDGLIPWRRIGGVTVIATAFPERFEHVVHVLERVFGPVVMTVTTEAEIHSTLATFRARHLVQRAESRVAPEISCRGNVSLTARLAFGLAGLGACALVVLAPRLALVLLLCWASVTLAAMSMLKATGAILAALRHHRAAPAHFNSIRTSSADPGALPTISVMVPLFREENIAGHLLQRLRRLRYPRALTDIVLICEEDDRTTTDALARTTLPPWMRVVRVPRGGVQTKPRALNYALDFCRGSIVGVWDAEDAPDPQQLRKVAHAFATAPQDVACLQGILDYYNTRTNWLSRCFTVEYAAWFRVMLPALAALRLPVPLGGTTLFFRRSVLEGLGGWDAHNVTEDADLGLRLCRAGYRTQLFDSVTQEEANCRSIAAWVKQRSRWLKGYGLTWAVHMRDPVGLWRDLGPWGFAGMQVLFLGTLSQFVLAPMLWVLWPLAFGIGGAEALGLSDGAIVALVTLSVLSGTVTLAASFCGLLAARKTELTPWLLTMPFYFPLAVLACYKGLWEGVCQPFHWQKTDHGSGDTPPPAATAQ